MTCPFASANYVRDFNLLRFEYYSLKMLMYLPCLLRTERSPRDDEQEYVHFYNRAAEACVKAAKDMVAILPEKPDSEYIYYNSLWWSIAHHRKCSKIVHGIHLVLLIRFIIVMEAMAILLLEFSYQSVHSGGSEVPTTESIKRSFSGFALCKPTMG